MTAWKSAVVRVAILGVTVFILAYLCLFFGVKSARFQLWIKTEFAQRTGYEISLRNLSLLPPFRLVATAVTFSKSSKVLMESDRVVLTFNPLDVFSKSVHRIRLQRPILRVDFKELFDASRQTSGNFPIRHLNVEDGIVVLNVGETNNFELRSVNVDATNLNLGQSAGLNLQADVPWLKGTAEISVRGHDEQIAAAILLRQETQSRLSRLLQPKGQAVLPLEAHFKLRQQENQLVQVTGLGKLNGLKLGAGEISGNFDSELRLVPGQTDANLSAKVTLNDFPSRLDVLPITLPPGTATANLQGTYSLARKVVDIKSLRLTSPLGNAEGSGQVTFTPQATFSAAQLHLRSIPLENLRSLLPQPAGNWTYSGAADADLELQGPWRAPAIKGIARAAGLQLRGDQFSLADLTLKAPVEWTDNSFLAKDVQLKGKKFAVNGSGRTQISADEIGFAGGLEKKENQPFRALGTVHILRGRFATPDGAKVGENLTLNGRFDAAANRAQGTTSLKGNLVVEEGELLWGKFFGDLKSQRPSFDFDGDYTSDDDAIRLRRLTLGLATIGSVDVTGSIEQLSRNGLLNLEAKSGDVQTGPAYAFFIRETLNRSYPFLNQLTTTGRLAFSVQARGSIDNLSAEGTLELRNAEVRTEKARFGPLELALPFQVRLPGAMSQTTPANLPVGNLTIASARIGSEPIGAIKTSVSLWNNQLQFRQPIAIPVYGGTIEVNNLAWQDIIKAPRAVSLSIGAKNLQLERLTESLGWHRFGGTLAGSIPQVQWTDNSLRSRGEIEIRVFEGRVRIGTMEIENPFSSIPSIKLDAGFQDIHLDQASETFAFGSISGILEGTVNDLVIVAGQPAQFRADLHTVDKPGSSQWISVEALNKITVLSSGNDAGPLYGGLAGFFENFRYSKMGFRAVLRNDKLILRGIESKDGKEYLVVGSWLPPTVNIISHTQEIGFSELLRRLERISEKPATH
jgi:hypothetical protein